MEKIGVIVGSGKLPVYFLEEAEKFGFDVYPLGLFRSIAPEIKAHKNFQTFNIGQADAILKFLLKGGITKLVMLGKVEKKLIFEDMQLDNIGEELMKKLSDRKDESLLFGIIVLFRLNGIKVLSQNHLLKNLMLKKKCYTKIIPDEKDRITIIMGRKVAKILSSFDVGQSVVCKDRSIVALEGIEGTDQTLLRAYELAGKELILVKMARPQQDMRVDIPAIGVETIKKLVEIGAKGLVGEANRMLFLEQDECIKLADKNGIFIEGI